MANSISLQTALTQLNLYQAQGIAVAINEEVIPKQHWAKQELKDQDEVLIITATQGG